MAYTIGVIRVLTQDDPEKVSLHGKLIEKYYPGVKTISECLPGQPEGVYNDETEALAAPKVVTLTKDLADRGCDAVIISCAGDPGLEEAKKAVSIPVIGAGESTAFLASGYGEVFGVLGITDDVPRAYPKYLKKILPGFRPPEVHNTLDLMTDWGREACFKEARRLKEAGAEAIAIACTGMATIGIAKELEKDIGIPVIDPVMAEAAMAYFAVLRRK